MSRTAVLTERRFDSICARMARLDARIRQAPGQLSLNLSGKAASRDGQPCGQGWISADKTCRKGAGGTSAKPLHPLFQATVERRAAEQRQKSERRPTTSGNVELSSDEDGGLLINGKPPSKALGGGAFGDTYMAEGPDGPLVVKVDRLNNGDPMETDPGVSRQQQRRNMVERERANMQRAHELGLGPEPVGDVTELSNGRLAFAYRMQPGSKLGEDHRAIEPTEEAKALLRQPGAMGRYATGIRRLARVMADSGFEHGDLHGGNILVGPDGSPSLIDWGMAKQSDKGQRPLDVARRESSALFVLGSNLVKANEAIQGGGRGGTSSKPSIDKFLQDVMSRTWKAERAYAAVIEAHDEAAFEAGYDTQVSDPGKRIMEANRLVREQGMNFNDAERQVGLLPPLTDSAVKEAERARDRIFGPDHLRRFRRTVDRHYAAWERATTR